ncbi:acyltransferase family protein [Haloferula sp.]|uniref:acyltransferase family protein n=1 Tax=Haloferula sp. TaxID=2497595 RepID=UPI003C75207F
MRGLSGESVTTGSSSVSDKSPKGDGGAEHGKESHGGRGYLPALDGLRGIAILLVVIYHCSELVHLKTTGNPFDWFTWRVFQLGWIGVDLFFVLSGFLITGILIESKSKPRYYQTFYARRSLRIFPLYYVVVFFTFFVFPQIADVIASKSASAAEALAELPPLEGKLPWYLFYASNFLAALDGNMGHRLLAVTWSLAIEEQFYFVWPLIIYVCRQKTVLVISWAMVVIAFVCRFAMVVAIREGYWDGNRTGPYVLPFCRMDALAVGAIISVMWRQPGKIEWLRIWSKRVVLFGLPFFLLAILTGRFGNRDGFVQTFGFSLLAFFFGGILVLTLLLKENGKVYRMVTNGGLLQIGKFAYAIYLFHLPLMFGLQALWFKNFLNLKLVGSSIPSLLIFISVVTAAVFIAAKLSWIFIERPFLKMKRFFPSSSDSVSAQRET